MLWSNKASSELGSVTHITAANYSGTATTAPLSYFLVASSMPIVPYGGYFCHEFVRVDSFYVAATRNFSQVRPKRRPFKGKTFTSIAIKSM